MSPSRFPSLRPSLTVSVTMFLVLVGCSLIGLDIVNMSSARDERVAQARRESANLARSLSEHARSTFRTADTILIGLRERFEHDLDVQGAPERIRRVMQLRLTSEPVLEGLSITDENGNWVTGTADGPAADDRKHATFFRHRDDPADNIVIGLPYRSPTDGGWIIGLSRRLSHPDGRFAGVIEATIPTSLFQRSYDTFDIGKEGTIAMTTDSGRLLVRKPFVEGRLGQAIASGDLLHRVSGRITPGNAEFVSTIDGRARLGSFVPLPRYGLTVSVSLDKAEILAPWRHEVLINICWFGVVAALVALLGHRMVRQIRERVRAERDYRLLADNSNDVIVCTGLDGTRRYISPSFYALTGWTEAEFAGRSTIDIVHPDDRPIAEASIARLRAGATQFTAQVRYLKPDGSFVWVEMRARIAPSGNGPPSEFVGNIRDITVQRLAEDALAEANAELAAMTLTDPLTGIANRRHFEQTLRREWNRAMRNGSSLALVMVDADHFKSFNDRYGHPCGDECLKTVACVLAGAARRPGDIAARYGGEEFVVILPETACFTAALVAGRMMEALAEARIPHEGNPPGIVTISIGVTAMVPAIGSNPNTLVAAADAALYLAKQQGRDRMVVSEPEREEHVLAA